MADEDRYTREAVNETIEVDKDNLDFDTIANICVMIEETLHKEVTKFTDVLEKLTKTYRKEFVIGEFSNWISTWYDKKSFVFKQRVQGDNA